MESDDDDDDPDDGEQLAPPHRVPRVNGGGF
jgi:hypothetical protein